MRLALLQFFLLPAVHLAEVRILPTGNCKTRNIDMSLTINRPLLSAKVGHHLDMALAG